MFHLQILLSLEVRGAVFFLCFINASWEPEYIDAANCNSLSLWNTWILHFFAVEFALFMLSKYMQWHRRGGGEWRGSTPPLWKVSCPRMFWAKSEKSISMESVYGYSLKSNEAHWQLNLKFPKHSGQLLPLRFALTCLVPCYNVC